jgi:serine/threonine protein kinase
MSAFHEVLALRTVHHPFIVRLEKAFATPKFFALLLELCPTDLNRKLCELEDRDTERFTGLGVENTARYLGQVLIAIRHMHKIKIVYRDLKPENILVSLDDEAKVADFGLAKAVGQTERMTMCGTMGFFPPELLNDGLMTDSEDDEEDGRRTTLDGSERRSDRDSRAALSRIAASSNATTRRSSESNRDSSFDPFKLDSYSYGVTLQVCLLGEDGAQKKEIRKKGAMMLPMHLSEDENKELLNTLKENKRLSEEAYDLLVNKLLPFRPRQRCRLLEDCIIDHDFFLKTLNCKNLEKHMMPNRH